MSEASNISGAEIEDWEDLLDKDHEDLTDAELTSKIKLSIRRRYSYPEWALVYEMGLGNGRVADAFAVGLMPSRNFKVIGFEFKASRSDWLREKNEPSKADEFVQLCDEWYVVAGDTDIVNQDELPEGWGLLELKPNSEQLWELSPSNLTDHQAGDPDRGFWGRFIKKTVGKESNYTVADLREARKRGYEDGKETAKQYDLKGNAEKLREKADAYDELRKNSPLRLPYDGDIDDERLSRLHRADQLLATIQEDSYGTLEHDLESLEGRAESAIDGFREDVRELMDGLEQLRADLEEASNP